MASSEESSYRQILKATSVVGGAKIFEIIIRIIRNKIIAVLLGPAGIGVSGLYYSTLELVHSTTGLGLSFSAVRDVAEAAGSGDENRIARTITILRRWVWLTGILGMFVVLIFNKSFSQYAFKDYSHRSDFLLLSIIPLFNALSEGQIVLLRGIRRIGDMARASVYGAIVGLIITVPLYWLYGVNGIVPAMILSFLARFCISRYFARKIKIKSVEITIRDTISGGAGMIRLGLFTVLTSMATTGTMYLIRIFISNKIGIAGVGQFQAAWSLSASYVGLILSAMASDYFPRLSAVNKDNLKIYKLVNEQTKIALIIGGAIVVVMICFMDIIITLLYSNKFNQSIDILLWQTIGNLLKVISWPMGFILLAKSRGGWYIFIELLSNALLFGTIWFSWNWFGLESVGIAFVVMYGVNVALLYFANHRICNFSLSKNNIRMIFYYFSLTSIAFLNIKFKVFPFWRILSVIIMIVVVYISYYYLNNIIDIKNEISIFLNKFKNINKDED